MDTATAIQKRSPAEDGYLLIAVMFLLFVFVLSLSIGAPLIAKSIQRDREVETMERGKQYQRAIQLYYRKFGAYPPSLDALVKTNNIRFLRKKYVDPMTGKSDWKPILFGQNKAPMAMGFFGEPLAGGATALAGTGPTGGNAAQGAGPRATTGTGITGTSGIGGTSIFGGTSLGSNMTSPTGTSATSTPATGQTGTTNTTSTSGTATGSGTSSASSSSTSTGSTGGQTFGGAGVVGVEPPLEKQSILIYKKKQKYSEWEFTYSPISDQMKQMGGNAGTAGQPASSLSRPFGSSPTASPSSNTTPSSGSSTTPQPQP